MRANQKNRGQSGIRAALAALRATQPKQNDPEAAETLRRGLAARDPRIVCEAAQLCRERGFVSLATDLSDAFNRFASTFAGADADCHAKTSLVATLHQLQCADLEAFRCGIGFYGPKRSLAGQRDRASLLRVASARAFAELAQLPLTDLLEPLIELLGDPVPQVRAAAAHVVGSVGGREAASVLRLTANLDSSTFEVVDACFSALRAIDPQSSVQFVSRFLKSDSDQIRSAAALSLAKTRTEAAFDAMIGEWIAQPDREFRKGLIYAMALMRTDKSFDFLLSLLESGDENAEETIHSLGYLRGSKTHCERIEAVVCAAGQSRVIRSLRDVFCPPDHNRSEDSVGEA